MASHKHKWEEGWCECPFCPIDHFGCKCGAEKIIYQNGTEEIHESI